MMPVSEQLQPTLALIGTGKVGTVLARLWYEAGYSISTVFNRTPAHTATLLQFIDARIATTPFEAVQSADMTLLAVSDDAIETVAHDIARFANHDLIGKAVIHSSGAQSSQRLAVLKQHGAWVGSLHPIFPFADIASATARLPGATFAIESDDEHLHDWLIGMVTALNGHVMVIPPGQKALYHSALSIISNYTVTLYAIVEKLLTELGAEQQTVRVTLNTLLTATVDNLVAQDTQDALTGPLVRGDAVTIQAHLEALAKQDRQLFDLYQQLARLTLPLVSARGVSTDKLKHLLRKEESDATDHS